MTSRHLASAAAAASLAGVALLGLSAPAFAQVYPPAGGATITDETVAPGQTVTVNSGPGTFDAGTDVTVVVTDTDVSGTVTADANGNAAFTFTLPVGTPAGPTTIVFSGTNGGEAATVSVPFTVVASGAADGGGQVDDGGALPRTGSDEIVPLTITGIALVGVGASIVVAARRRREAPMPGGLA